MKTEDNLQMRKPVMEIYSKKLSIEAMIGQVLRVISEK